MMHKIAAHSITDKGPIFDAYHYYQMATDMLEGMIIKFIDGIKHKEMEKMFIGKPKFYYKNSKVVKGADDDIINGYIIISASGPMFPEIIFKIYIKDRKLEKPEKFRDINKEYSFTPEGFRQWLGEKNTRYTLDNEDKYPYPTLSGAKIPTVFFGDDSKDREDLMLAPVETGDQIMWGRSTGPYVGV